MMYQKIANTKRITNSQKVHESCSTQIQIQTNSPVFKGTESSCFEHVDHPGLSNLQSPRCLRKREGGGRDFRVARSVGQQKIQSSN